MIMVRTMPQDYMKLAAVMATPVLFWIGLDTLKSGWKSLISGNPNMDSLIMLGTMAAYLTGPAVFLFPLITILVYL